MRFYDEKSLPSTIYASDVPFVFTSYTFLKQCLKIIHYIFGFCKSFFIENKFFIGSLLPESRV